MDEGTLVASIQTYSGQLQQVEAALAAGVDPEQRADLLQLRGDLQQLVELTESSLLSLRKSQLLASLEEHTEALQGHTEQSQLLANHLGAANTDSQQGHTELGEHGDECASFYSELTGLGGDSHSSAPAREDHGEEEEEEEEVISSGSKVRAPYRTSWGTLEYHNAMVMDAEPAEEGEELVRVLYLHPTHRAMKPCPFYLEDKCRFPDNCRFSHGEVVAVAELRDFLEADLSELEEGSSCLARHDDGVWYPAKITELKGGVYKVKFDSLLLKEAELEADGVIPPMRTDDPVSSQSESEEDADAGFAKVVDSVDTGWTAVNCSEFGGWEVHTRGIGSRLLMKMGYEQGKGLGKGLEGRVEPVQAVVVPRGAAALAECGELTRALASQVRRPKPPGGAATGPRKRLRRKRGGGGEPNVFDFLNAKLGPAQGRSSGPAAAAAPRDAYRGRQSDKRAMNVQLFQATERVAQTQKEIQELTHSLKRKAGRDAAVVSRLEEKLAAAQKRLVQQKSQEQLLQSQRKRADTHKNMTEF
ncbi:zinc finger CCCH-type with G patch domain-containing protein [Alosa alosa]|nr:zinc finger CCCH-type with G patch domain-containing protein [Alosa alosa]XP_048098212.1 zinc finger CCCH-type with G patch domain-containing protein [Alosa alosa]